MSLGVVFKGPEGVVLATDSRVTLTGTLNTGMTIPATYDNAIKLLHVKNQDFVGVVTFGQGAIGSAEPRTAHSYLPEFEDEIAPEPRLSVEAFAARLGGFFLTRWNAASMPANADPMVFLVAGFDDGEVYGRAFEVIIPTMPTPAERLAGQFGLWWGGQSEVVTRMLNGYDPALIELATTALSLDATQAAALTAAAAQLGLRIPYAFLPLQDCVDLAIFLVRSTAMLQKWLVGIRGVGGAIDVATITRTEGFRAIQSKSIRGE